MIHTERLLARDDVMPVQHGPLSWLLQAVS